MSTDKMHAVGMQFNGQSVLVFFFALCLLNSEEETVRSSPLSSLHVHSFNVDLELVDGSGNWNFKEVWGLSYLYQSSDGFVTLGCLGKCTIRGELPKDQQLHLHQFYGDLYVDSLDVVHAEVIGGNVALYNVKRSDVRQASGDIDLILPHNATTVVLKSKGDVSLYLPHFQETTIREQSSKILHLSQGEEEIYIHSNKGQILWNGQDSFADGVAY